MAKPAVNMSADNASMHKDMANAIRALAMDAVEQAKSGHPGAPMGAADMAYVLWSKYLRFDPADPQWPNRDRFVLSAGPGSMLLYAAASDRLSGMTIDELKRFRQLGSRSGPSRGWHAPGIETTTGPLRRARQRSRHSAGRASVNARHGTPSSITTPT